MRTEVVGREEAVRASSNLGETIVGTPDRAKLAIVAARFNGEITLKLLEGASRAAQEVGAIEGLTVAWVPGSFELPLVARQLALSDKYDAVVCLGCVIRGETSHYDFVAGECARGIQDVQLETGVPVAFGVLTTETLDQALERAGGKVADTGYDVTMGVLEMADLLRRLPGAKGRPQGAGRAGFGLAPTSRR